LLEKAGAVAGVHVDELYGHAMTFADATDDSAAADLPDGKIQQDLNEAAKRNELLGANKQPANAEAFHKRDTAPGAGLPGHNHSVGGLYARIASLLGSEHSKTSGVLF